MRFKIIEDNEKFPVDEETCWYWDLERPLSGSQPFVAVQSYRDKNPNDFVRIDQMHLLFTDQAEYYAVCEDCYYAYRYMQWSGNTYLQGYVQRSQKYLKYHAQKKGWCEFCDPIFGNGGWLI